MNNVNEKGSINYISEITGQLHHPGGENSTVALPVHAYVHDNVPQSKGFANPGPLGIFSVASTSFVLSMYNVQARGVTVPNAVIGMACFVGGAAQFAAGMWDFANGNLFGATAFASYGSFWMAYATFLHPAFGIQLAYAGHPGQLSNAIGLFLAPWFILTFIFLLATLRTNLVLVLVFFFLDMTFLTLMISEFAESLTILKIGGGFGLATAAVSFYLGAAQLLDEENSLFTLPLVPFSRSRLD